MAFDGENFNNPAVTARDRLVMLRDFLADLSDAEFDISHMFSDCGTAACIQGWAIVHFGWATTHSDARFEAEFGLSPDQRRELTMPLNYDCRSDLYTRARAVKVLDHLLETGEVDWSVAFK